MADAVGISTDATFDNDVKAGDYVLVDFWAEWCGPCRAVAPVLEQIAQERAGTLLIKKLNVDENPGTASKLGVTSLPTMLLFKDGKVVGQSIGAKPKAALLTFIDQHQ